MIDTPYQLKSLASRVRGMHGALDADELAKLLGVAKVNVSSECSSSEPLRPAREPARKVQQSRPGHRPLAAFEVITGGSARRLPGFAVLFLRFGCEMCTGLKKIADYVKVHH